MVAKILNGKKIAEKITRQIKTEVSKLPFKPVFCDVLVGNNLASRQYVNMKAREAVSVGMVFHRAEFNENIKTSALVGEIKKLNRLPNMCGLIVQLPLPKNVDSKKILDAIEPSIDVDATGKINTKKFYENYAHGIFFPTAAAIMEMLKQFGKSLSKKKFLVLGQGQLVGLPVTHLLRTQGYEVSVARSTTANTSELLKNADVVISAVGKPKFLKGSDLKKGSIIIDAGTAESNGGVAGDVDYESVKKVASHISPVPGGVGPVTVAMLLKNVLQVAKNKIL